MAISDLADKVALLTEAIRDDAHPARSGPLYGPIIVRAEAACAALARVGAPKRASRPGPRGSRLAPRVSLGSAIGRKAP